MQLLSGMHWYITITPSECINTVRVNIRFSGAPGICPIELAKLRSSWETYNSSDWEVDLSLIQKEILKFGNPIDLCDREGGPLRFSVFQLDRDKYKAPERPEAEERKKENLCFKFLLQYHWQVPK